MYIIPPLKLAPAIGILAFGLLFLPGCSSDVVFREFKTTGEDYTWNRADTVVIPVHITDNSAPYVFELGFRCATGFPYSSLSVRIEETRPDGRSSFRDADVPVRSEDGSFYGEKGFDIVDLTAVISESHEFATHGTYTYRITHRMDADLLDYAMEIGLILRRPDGSG
jgi:gliding motility-associated lipoprotein GldH